MIKKRVSIKFRKKKTHVFWVAFLPANDFSHEIWSAHLFPSASESPLELPLYIGREIKQIGNIFIKINTTFFLYWMRIWISHQTHLLSAPPRRFTHWTNRSCNSWVHRIRVLLGITAPDETEVRELSEILLWKGLEDCCFCLTQSQINFQNNHNQFIMKLYKCRIKKKFRLERKNLL